MKLDISINDDTKAALSAHLERRNARIAQFNENHPDEKKERATLSDMASELVNTGAMRRAAANKWADEHKAPPKPRKPRAAKKAAAPKPRKPRAAKKAAAPKAKKVKPHPEKKPTEIGGIVSPQQVEKAKDAGDDLIG